MAPRAPPELIENVLNETIKLEPISYTESDPSGYVNAFPEEISTIERFFYGHLNAKTAAAQLMTVTSEQRAAESENRSDTKDARVGTLLYSIVLESPDLHALMYELNGAIDHYLNTTEREEPSAVLDEFNDLVSDGWACKFTLHPPLCFPLPGDENFCRWCVNTYCV